MITVEYSICIKPFKFPNYLHVTEIEDTLDVGLLSREQAEAYWDEMKALWLEHVESRNYILARSRGGQ